MVAVTIVFEQIGNGIVINCGSSEREATARENMLAERVNDYLLDLIGAGMDGPSLSTACATLYQLVTAHRADLVTAGVNKDDLVTMLAYAEDALPAQEKTRLAAG